MNRNMVLTAATAFVLILMFVGYKRIVRDPAPERVDNKRLDEIAPPDAESRRDALKIGPDGQVEIPGGEGFDYTVYDDRTGLAIRRIKCESMRPTAGTQKEAHLLKPEFSQRLPSGGTATVSADEGVIDAERVDKTAAALRQGRLFGHVKIVVDRRPFGDDAAIEGGDADQVVTITLDDLDFDIELGKLKTDGPLKVIGPDFEIEGIGLNLTWNQAANRIDELHIRQGKRLALYREGALLGFGDPPAEAEPSKDPARESDAPPHRRPTAARRIASYLCTLKGAIDAHRYDDTGQAVASLSAGGLELLFDMGNGGGMFGGGKSADDGATTQPASRPARNKLARLELNWNGPLSLMPAPAAARPMRWGHKRGDKPPPPAARRRLTALGPDVLLRQGDSTILCGRLEFFDDSGRIWLHREGHPNVRMKLDENSWATAAAIYIDRAANIINLVGDVYLESSRPSNWSSAAAAPDKGGKDAGVMTISCSQIAELHLYPAGDDESRDLGDELKNVSSTLRSASFFGDVRVRMNDRQLATHQLDMRFRKLAAGEAFEALIEQAVATGSILFTANNDRVESGRLVLDFGIAADGRPFVSRIDANGGVEMTRGDSWLRGQRVVALLDQPVQSDAPQQTEDLAVRTLDVYGRAELQRPGDHIGARGDHIAVWIAGENEFERAEIIGSIEQPALVHATPYTVRGSQIDINGPDLSLRVDGWSRLTFVSQRGFQGERGRPAKVVVTSDRALHIDGLKNTVFIDGNVVAARGNEQLKGDSLTLFLEDVEPPHDARPAVPGLSQFLHAVRASLFGQTAEPLAGGGRRDDASTGVFGVTRAQLGRKEPVRLQAVNALVRTEIADPTSDRPLVHRSMSAPLIEVDIVNQTTYTTGLTDLLVQDYRVAPGAEKAAQFIPSDLISGGPIQTVIRCEDGLTYALGGNEPDARDSAVLRGGVQMLHLSGREILDFDKMPRMARLDDETLQRLRDRHTTLDCERLECQFGRRGGDAGQAGGAARVGSQLVWLLGSGKVFLRDRQGDQTTEINAGRISFDRPTAIISVFGEENAEARVYRWNTSQGKFSMPYVGPELRLDLRGNTIRTSGGGEIRP